MDSARVAWQYVQEGSLARWMLGKGPGTWETQCSVMRILTADWSRSVCRMQKVQTHRLLTISE